MRQNICLFIILILAIYILFYNADKKFIGHHDWNGVVYANIARNYNRYGFLQTKFGQVRNYDLTTPSRFDYFTHYPPLLPILIAFSFRIFGESELSARLVPIIASGVLLFFIYLIGTKIGSKETKFIAVSILPVLPIFIYFGKMPVHETVSPAFSLAGIYFYLRWFSSRNKVDFLLMVSFLVLGILTSWAGYYTLPPLVLYSFFFLEGKLRRKIIAFLLLLGFLMFGTHLIHVKILSGSFFGGGLLEVFLFRFNPYLSAKTYGFTFKNFLLTETRYFLIYYTKIIVLISLIWWITLLHKFIKGKGKINFEDGIFLILFVYGVTHLILFSNMAFIHDYMIYYLLPFIVLSSSEIICKLLKKISFIPLKVSFFVFLLFLISTERIVYVKTLLTTDMNEKGYKLGKFIKEKTKTGERVLVGSNHFKEFQEVFIGYYSQREVDYSEAEVIDPFSFSLIIRLKAHDALPQVVKTKLDVMFVKNEDDNYIWYDVKELRRDYAES